MYNNKHMPNAIVEGFRKAMETNSIVVFVANEDVKTISKKHQIAFKKIGKITKTDMGMDDTRYPDDLRITVTITKKVKEFL